VSAEESATIHPLEALRLLRVAGKTLLSQAGLHVELLRIEWTEEKLRLQRMLAVGLIGFACLLCVMLSVGGIALAISWNTPYRIVAILLVMAAYVIGAAIAWNRLRSLGAQSSTAFAATRAELAADLTLIRSKLEKPSI
jgi:uncharacterized membrane protein YqjE